MYFDTHTHLNDRPFTEDLDAYITRAEEAGVKRMNLVAYDLPSSVRAVDLSRDRDGLYAVIGIHPHDADSWNEQAAETLTHLAREPRVVAIGEIGLDYHFEDRHSDEVQARAFCGQMDLAYALDLPVVIHARDADRDIYNLVKAQKEKGKLRDLPGVFHCYSSDLDLADKLLDLGFYLGFDGPVTFKNGKENLAVASAIPLDRLVLETDCPYLAPVPKRGTTNEPSFLPFIGQKIAQARGMTEEDLATKTMENSLKLFGIEP